MPAAPVSYEKLLTSVERLAVLVECLFGEIRALRDEQRVQLKRLGHLQAELAALKKATARYKMRNAA